MQPATNNTDGAALPESQLSKGFDTLKHKNAHAHKHA
jgi:hypothetical protein